MRKHLLSVLPLSSQCTARSLLKWLVPTPKLSAAHCFWIRVRRVWAPWLSSLCSHQQYPGRGPGSGRANPSNGSFVHLFFCRTTTSGHNGSHIPTHSNGPSTQFVSNTNSTRGIGNSIDCTPWTQGDRQLRRKRLSNPQFRCAWACMRRITGHQ